MSQALLTARVCRTNISSNYQFTVNLVFFIEHKVIIMITPSLAVTDWTKTLFTKLKMKRLIDVFQCFCRPRLNGKNDS